MLDVLFEGDRAVRRERRRAKTATSARCARKVVVDASGQNGLIQNRLRLRVWDPVLNKGAIWTYWEGRLPRHRARRRRHARDPDREQERLVLVHPAPRQHRQRRRRGARSTTSSRAAAVRRDLRGGSRALSGGEGARLEGEARHRLLRDQGLLVSRDPGGRRRLGAGRRRLRLPRSAVFVGRAAGAAVGRAGGRRHLSRGLRRATPRPRSSASGAPPSTKASTACAAWCASTTTASASASSSRTSRTCAARSPTS